MLDNNYQIKRPQAPHVQVYRWTITMAASILHRLTGIALYVGTFFLTFWLFGLAYSPSIFSFLQDLYKSIPGQIIAFLYSYALILHMFGGLRHIICEHQSRLLDKVYADKIAYGTIIGAFVCTVIVWLIGYFW